MPLPRSDPEFGFGRGQVERQKGARIDEHREYMGVKCGRDVPFPMEGISPSPLGKWCGEGAVPPPRKNFLGSRNAYFGACSGPSECLLLHCNTSMSRPSLRLHTLIFQADCISGSIKCAAWSFCGRWHGTLPSQRISAYISRNRNHRPTSCDCMSTVCLSVTLVGCDHRLETLETKCTAN